MRSVILGRALSFLAFLFCTLPAFGVTAFVQECTPATSNASTVAVTCNSIGTNLVIVGAASDGSETVSGVADNAAHTFTKATNSPCVNGGRVYIYYFNYTSTGGTRIITATFSSNTQAHTVWAMEFSGADGTLDTDTITSCTGTGTAVNTPTITPTVTGGIIFAACYVGGTISVSTGSWTKGTVMNGEDVEYQVNVGTSGVSTGFTQSPSSGWACTAAAFKAAGGATPATRSRGSIFGLWLWPTFLPSEIFK